MKNRIILLITIVLISFNVSAQVDRSIQPVGGPTPKIKLEKPKEFKLKNGIKVLVVEDHKLPRVSYSLRIDGTPIIEGDKAGVLSILEGMLGNGTTSIEKDVFNDEIDYLGANVSIGFRSSFASSLTKHNDRILELMADAIINPLLTIEEFDKTKEQLIEGFKADEKSIDAISGRVGNALSYGKSHVYGEFVSEETLKNISYEDVIEFHKKYTYPNSAYIVVIGDINFKEVKKSVTEKFSGWKKAKKVESDIPVLTPNVSLTEVNFIDLPSATQSSISVTNNVDLKMNDEDYFTALITNNILGGGGEGYLFKNLREDKGYTYGAYSSLGSSRYGVSRFSAGAKVRNMVTDSAVTEIVNEIVRIRTELVDAELLKNAKAKYVGNFIMRLERPQTIANYALNIKLNDLPEDFYETYLEKINAVNAEDVKRVANKYFNIANTRIVIVGKGSDVVGNLEEVGFPINYFDKYANPVAKPVFNKAIPDGLTAIDVMSSYIDAIGGKDNLVKVNTMTTKADVTIPGAPFKPVATIKMKMPNKSSFSIKANMGGQEMVLMKRNFSGEKGYMEQQGQTMMMSEEEINEAKLVEGIFDELYFTDDQIELVSINSIDNEDVYKIKVTKNEKTSFRYYNAESGLLISVEEQDESKNISSTTKYDDYRNVDGVMIPFYLEQNAGGQNLEFVITEVKINEDLKDSDFY
ncbi:insulinase family protein [Flavobacteriaceae bacterium]|nr:insulinase family protein [Flavobacteriaceae bacterium]MDC1492061.1 insulinase family protein [Flavobacteriaceae bacterium]